jgi:hypothetical protein
LFESTSAAAAAVVVAVVVFVSFCSGLELVGLFRISASSSVVEYYRSQYDQGVDVGFANCNDPHIAANLLKMYFRELPEPLFTFELLDCFIAIGMLLCWLLLVVSINCATQYPSQPYYACTLTPSSP